MHTYTLKCLFISVLFAWEIMVASVLQWTWSTRDNDLLGSHGYRLHLFWWKITSSPRVSQCCFSAWWSFLKLWRCELYTKVYYCSDSCMFSSAARQLLMFCRCHSQHIHMHNVYILASGRYQSVVTICANKLKGSTSAASAKGSLVCLDKLCSDESGLTLHTYKHVSSLYCYRNVTACVLATTML